MPESEPPIAGAGVPPPLLPTGGSSPPLLSPPLPPHRNGARHFFAILLSLFLALFLADAIVSLLDDSLIILFGVHLLTMLRAMVFLAALFAAIVIYALMGLTPMIPKRVFLPLTLFSALLSLVAVPCWIYFHNRFQAVAWALSLCQVIFGVGMLCLLQGGFKLRWPLAPERWLREGRRFSWTNLLLFLAANVLVLLPAVAAYLFLCASLAADHFTGGFLAFHPRGMTVQVRKYVRADGKTIQLFPMAHVGDPNFYQKVAQSFPSNSIILMEGVSDERNLLTNRITYKRMATSLGLSEQAQEFRPVQGEMVRADVDVEVFAQNTIDFLNLVMRIHTQGLDARNVRELLQYKPPPRFEEQIWDDLLRKRNEHLLKEIHSRLADAETENIMVPWGVAHMPEIAKEIQKDGFKLEGERQYVVIRFGPDRIARRK
jgi:hypothetical protein